MDRYTHTQEEQLTDAISKLPSIAESTKWTEKGTESSVPTSHRGASDGTSDNQHPNNEESTQVVDSSQVVTPILAKALDDTSSPGGTRTPDQGIMSSLL